MTIQEQENILTLNGKRQLGHVQQKDVAVRIFQDMPFTQDLMILHLNFQT